MLNVVPAPPRRRVTHPSGAATVALVVTIGLLLVHGWMGGRASRLHGLRLLAP